MSFFDAIHANDVIVFAVYLGIVALAFAVIAITPANRKDAALAQIGSQELLAQKMACLTKLMWHMWRSYSRSILFVAGAISLIALITALIERASIMDVIVFPLFCLIFFAVLGEVLVTAFAVARYISLKKRILLDSKT